MHVLELTDEARQVQQKINEPAKDVRSFQNTYDLYDPYEGWDLKTFFIVMFGFFIISAPASLLFLAPWGFWFIPIIPIAVLVITAGSLIVKSIAFGVYRFKYRMYRKCYPKTVKRLHAKIAELYDREDILVAPNGLMDIWDAQREELGIDIAEPRAQLDQFPDLARRIVKMQRKRLNKETNEQDRSDLYDRMVQFMNIELDPLSKQIEQEKAEEAKLAKIRKLEASDAIEARRAAKLEADRESERVANMIESAKKTDEEIKAIAKQKEHDLEIQVLMNTPY